MAYVNSRSASLSISDRFSSVVKMVKEAVARRRLYSRTLAELTALTDRDLTDLGLSRANIADLAYEAAYAK
jgi:uncharacterized protein YjiS (DUF1127 family)